MFHSSCVAVYMNKNKQDFVHLSQIYIIIVIITNSIKIAAKYVQWFLATSKQHLKDDQKFDKAAPSLRKSLVHENYN